MTGTRHYYQIGVVLWLACCSVYSQDDFYFRKWPTAPSGPIKTGQSLRLDCRVSVEDRIAISWTLAGELLLNSSRRYQDPATGDLIIRRADHRLDAGDFACTATNVSSGFSIASQPATLTILWIGNGTRVTAQVAGKELVEGTNVKLGEEVVLHCLAEGSAELQYDWHLNGRKIPKTGKSKTLVISSVSPTESGTYSCSAKNGAGPTRFNAPFIVSIGTKKLVRFNKEVIASPDSPVKLPCAFEPATSVQWLFRGVTTKFAVDEDGQMIIPKLSQNDEGWYICRASSGEEYATLLKVAYLNDFSKAAIDPPPPHPNGFHYFAEYSSVELTCIAPEGMPVPVVWWEGPQNRILSVPTRSSESVLTLSRVLPEDAGTYTCRAENSVRKLSMPVNLVVTVPPTIQQHPMSTSVNEGEEALMSCTYSGASPPATTIRWSKDGHPLADSLMGVHLGTRNASLRFSSTGKHHVGSYSCTVQTIGHSSVTSQPASLQVRENLKFTMVPSGRKLELGSSSKVHCRAQGTPAPVIRWAKEGLPLFTWPQHIEDINGTLYFHGVRPDDAGRYTCIATNSQGLINTTVHIDVIVMPYFTSLPENITFAKEGQFVELSCRADGQPMPTIQWDKDSVMNGFSSDRFVVHPNGTLSIHSVQPEDEGHYGCTAGNAGGFKRAEFRLVVQGWDYQAEHDGESITKTIVITLGAAAAYILLSVGLLIWCRLKRRQRKLRSPDGTDAQSPTPQTALLTKEGQVESGLVHPIVADKLNVPSSAITKGTLLGKGRFGDVLEGFVTGLGEGAGTRVLLRTLSTRDEELVLEFRRQVDMLHRVLHPNLTAVLAYCRDSVDSQLVLMEYQQHLSINLKSHLLAQPLTVAQVQSATAQIARGMNALAQSRFVHRDLGARNILVGFHGKENQISVKVGSFGLDGQPFSSDYCVYKHQKIPLRWLPHEAVLEDEYSTKSDVWMFAVCVWELYNAGQMPLSGRSDESILSELSRKSPALWGTEASFCKSNSLAILLVRCWSHDPQLRPSFDELLQCAEQNAPSSNKSR